MRGEHEGEGRPTVFLVAKSPRFCVRDAMPVPQQKLSVAGGWVQSDDCPPTVLLRHQLPPTTDAHGTCCAGVNPVALTHATFKRTAMRGGAGFAEVDHPNACALSLRLREVQAPPQARGQGSGLGLGVRLEGSGLRTGVVANIEPKQKKGRHWRYGMRL